MPYDIPDKLIHLDTTVTNFDILKDAKERRIYLTYEILALDDDEYRTGELSHLGQVVKFIFDCNREDKDLPSAERKPIKIYINSPGGDLSEGFPLVSTIELSKTPVYTINIGQWSSMSFYIGITGHKRFSLPNMTFLLHDGYAGHFGSTNKVQDRAKFEERLETEVIKEHVLKHSNMSSAEYDASARVEYYMLPDDALRHGFIDKIVTDINEIL